MNPEKETAARYRIGYRSANQPDTRAIAAAEPASEANDQDTSKGLKPCSMK